MSDDVDAVRAEIVRVARLLRSRGLAIGTSGNVGARLGDGRIAVTPSTMDYDEMTPADVVLLHPDGAPSEGRHRPSSEFRIHVEIFAARPDVDAIVHTHSPFATAWSAMRRDVPAFHYVLAPLVAAGRQTLRVAPYATFGTAELARNAVTTLDADHGVLLANHGAVAVSRTLAGALLRAERIEELAMIATRVTGLAGAGIKARALTAAELDDARDQMSRHPLQHSATDGSVR